MTDLDLFKQYVTEQQATTTTFAKWKSGSPNDYARWVAYRDEILAGKSAPIPTMTTHQGKALVLAARMAAPEVLPVPLPFIYPQPDASFRKISPGQNINVSSGDKIWLLPGQHGEIYCKNLDSVEIIGDPAGGVVTGAIKRFICNRVNIRNITVREGVILPFHTGSSDHCETTNVEVRQCGDSGFMDEDSTNVLYDYVTSLNPGRNNDGPGYPTHGMYMRCSGLIQNVIVRNAKGGGISLRRQGMTVRNALCDSKCDIGLSFYSFTTAPGEIIVENSTFGGVTADVWISDETNGPTPSISSPIGPHPTFRFRNVRYSGLSRDGFNIGSGIRSKILELNTINIHGTVA